MRRRILGTLNPIRLRQQSLSRIRWGAAGLFVSSLIGLALWLNQWRYPGLIFSTLWISSVVAAGPLAGVLIALIRDESWHRKAEAVDPEYRLKDRTLTALDFARTDVANGDHGAWRVIHFDVGSSHRGRLRPPCCDALLAVPSLPDACD